MFAGEDDLRYLEAQYQFETCLTLDAPYRLAHLPLVNPAHPDIIPRQTGTDYDMGRYDRQRISLIAPVPVAHLDNSEAYRRTLADLRASPIAGKIAWDIYEQRKSRLHLTICGRLETQWSKAEINACVSALTRRAAFRVRLGGPWIGAKNTGRFYLPVYPERNEAGDALSSIQRSLNWPETRLYVIGLWNLTDHLDEAETSALRQFMADHRDIIVSEFMVECLHLAATHDDLALSGQTQTIMMLRPGQTP